MPPIDHIIDCQHSFDSGDGSIYMVTVKRHVGWIRYHCERFMLRRLYGDRTHYERFIYYNSRLRWVAEKTGLTCPIRQSRELNRLFCEYQTTKQCEAFR